MYIAIWLVAAAGVGDPSTPLALFAGQDDRARALGQHLGHRHRVRHDLGVHVGLTDPAGDQLRVLRAVVDDENEVRLHHGSLPAHPFSSRL